MRASKEPIAIVGMSSLFPAAKNLQQFWHNIIYAVDAITDVPESHWRIEDYYDPDPQAEDKTYCKRGGFIPKTPFSPVEFGIPPNALDVIDVLQLLSLNVAKSALFDADYLANQRYESMRERTGVVLGITGANSLTQPLSNRLQSPKLKQVLASRGLSGQQIDEVIESFKKAYAPWEENSFPGMLGNVVSGRIANRFDMGGINCTIDAACASSLAALRMAIDELHSGRADMMLSGGCDAENTILMFMCFSKTPAFSHRGIISPFDAESDGTLIGEGMGMLALKRLSDAERDNDRIYALIKGLGASSDGKFKSIYAPRKEGQITCLRRAYADAEVPIESLGLIEAHGTGTKVGDATEVSALKAVLGEADTAHIALGSVKSQIGHTKAAAGAAGLIKMALALHHRVLPPTLNITKPADELLDEHSPLYVNNQTRPWFLNYPAEKRRAGISSFGFGGTNFHAVLEEYCGTQGRQKRLQGIKQPVVLGAQSMAQLQEQLSALVATGQAESGLENVAQQAYRLGFIAGSSAECQEKATLALTFVEQQKDQSHWHHPKGIYFSARPASKRIAALFSGQGSQYVNMARQATMAYPEFQQLLEAADIKLKQRTGEYLSNKIYPTPVYSDGEAQSQALVLRQTEFAQPAIGMVSAAAYRLLKQAGLRVDCTGGHSFGELTALWAASVINDDAFIDLAIARGDAMKPQPGQDDSGVMGAVAAAGDEVEKLLKEHSFDAVYLCNYNTQAQTVIGGLADQVNQFSNLLEQQGIRTTQLPVSAAFHTPLVAHAQGTFAKEIDAIEFKAAALPVYRNHDGQSIVDADKLKEGLKQQLLEPVRFVSMIEQMLAEGVDTFIEFGPKGHLAKMVAQICQQKDRPVEIIAVDNGNPEQAAEQLNQALVQLSVAGVALQGLGGYEPDYQEAPLKPGFNIELEGINYVSEERKTAWLTSLENASPVVCQESPAMAPEAPQPSEEHHQVAVATAVSPATNRELATLSKLPQADLSGPAVSPTESDISPEPVAATTEQPSGQLQLLDELLKGNSDLHSDYLQQSVETSHRTIALIEQLSHSYQASPQQFEAVAGLARQGMQIVADGQSQTSQSHQDYLRNTIDLAGIATQGHSLRAKVGESFVPEIGKARVSGGTDLVESRPAVNFDNTDFASPNFDNNRSASVTPISAAQTAAADSAIAAKQTSSEISPARQAEALAPATDSPASGLNIEQLSSTLLSVVAEKTGYPVDVLDLSMDIEADLGIDSIKRVEILGAMQEALPEMTQMQPEALGEVRSLQDILDVAGAEVKAAGGAEAGALNTTATAGVSAAEVTALFLQVVAEKTGYPEDVLDMSMSLEADLGIDSIKRVEILGELQKKLNLQDSLDPAALGELSTLSDITGYIETQMGSSATAASQMAPSVGETMGVGVAVDAAQAPDSAAVQDALLNIVSEKTGYPRDVIELTMDLEADLGIDSIKRVEILGSLQTMYPSLPAPPAELAGELRNLQQIVDFLSQSDSAASASQSQVEEASAVQVSPIRQHRVAVQRLRQVDELKDCYQPNARVLLVASEPLQTQALHDGLRAKGFNVTLLLLPDTEPCQADEKIQLEDWQPASLEARLAALPEMDIVLYQHPQSQATAEAIAPESMDMRALGHLLLLAKHYKKPLDQPAPGRKAFMTLARLDGQLGLRAPDKSFLAAGCFGLVKTLAVETERLFCRALDVDPALDAESLANKVIAELFDYNLNLTDVGLTDHARHSFTLAMDTEHGAVEPLPEDTCFIITGGARGITAACVQALAAGQPGKYLLLGRTPLADTQADWAQNVAESDLKARAAAQLKERGEKPLPKTINAMVNQVLGWREITATLNALNSLGVTARYVSLDIADAQAVAQWAQQDPWLQAAEHLALIHGAGALADRLIEDKQLAELARVFSVKLYGLSNLLANIDTNKLKLTALFSSVAGLFGNIGQVDYAMANEILNRLAVVLKGSCQRTLSFIWGAWNAGMVTPEIKKMFEARGIALIELDAGSKLFSQACLDPKANVLNMIGPSAGLASRQTNFTELADFTANLELSTEDLVNSKLLQAHSIGGEKVLPATFAMGWVVNIIENMFAGVLVRRCARMNVNKGMVLSATSAKKVALKIQVTGVDEQGHLLLDAQICSLDSPQLYYSFQGIELGRQLSALQDSLVTSDAQEINARQFYNDKTLFHGSDFQLLKSYQQPGENPRELLFTCQWLPEDEANLVDAYSAKAYCPMYADALLQAALVWVKKYEGMPSLPMLIEDLHCHEPIARGERLYIRVTLVEQSDSQSTLYLSALTKEGRVHLAMRAGVVKSAALAEKFSA